MSSPHLKRLILLWYYLCLSVIIIATYRYIHPSQDYWIEIPLQNNIPLCATDNSTVSLIGFEKTLTQASQDKHCLGIILHLQLREDQPATAEALAQAIKQFKKTPNKKVIAYTAQCVPSEILDKDHYQQATSLCNMYVAGHAHEWQHQKDISLNFIENIVYSEKEADLQTSRIPQVLQKEILQEGTYKSSNGEIVKLLNNQSQWMKNILLQKCKNIPQNKGKKPRGISYCL